VAVSNVELRVDARNAVQSLKKASDESKKLETATKGVTSATTKAGREIKTAANGMRYFTDAAGRARKVNGQFVTSAEAAAAGIKKQDTAARSLIGTMTKLAATAGAGRVTSGITRTAAGFEQELRRAAAIEGGGNLDQLRQSIERVASTAAGTPTEVAALATSLSRAGFTAQETSESLQGIVTGAEATSVAFDQLGDIVSSSLRAFGLATSGTASVVDTLVQAANSSNQTILDLGEALSYAAPGARTLGISIGDLSATIGLLADNGIRGSRAGTSLSTGLNRLQLAASGSQEALFEITRGSAMLTKAMDTLGSQVLDAEGNLKPLDEVLLALKGSLDQLNVGQRVELTKALFGEEAGRGFQALLASSEEKIRSMFQTIENSQGKTEQVREEMRGFSDSMKVLGGNVENTTNAIGDKFIVVLQPLVDGLNATLKAASELPKPIRDIGAAAAAAGIAVGGFAVAFKTAAPLIELVAYKLGAGGLAGAMAALLNPIALGAAAFVGLSAVVIKYYADQAKLNKLLNDSTVESTELKDAVSAKKAELEAAAVKLDKLRESSLSSKRATEAQRKEVEELRRQLEALEGVYDVRVNLEIAASQIAADVEAQAKAAGGKAVGFDVLDQAGIREAIARANGTYKEPEAFKPSVGGGGSGGGTAGGRAGRGPSAEDILKDQLAAGERIAKQLQREINLRNASNDLERELLRIKFNHEDVVANINANVAERQREELLNLAERNRLDQENLATIEARDERLQEAFKMDFASLFKQDQGKLQQFISDSQDSLKDLEQVAINVSQGVGSAISSSLVNGIQGLIEGSEKVKDVFANMLKSVGQVLAQEGARMIATYIAIGIAKAFAGLSGGTKFGDMGNFDQAVPGASGFSSPSSFNAAGLFGARANGGPVNANQPYIVGERGPELFMPFSSGMVLSNNDTREKLEQQDAVMGDNATREKLEQQDAVMSDSATRDRLKQQDDALSDSATRDRLKQQDAVMSDSAAREKLEQQDAVMSDSATRQQLKQQDAVMSDSATRSKLEQQDAVLRDSATREQLEQQDAVLRSNEAIRQQLEQQDAVLRDSATRDKLEQQDAVMRSNETTRQQLIKQQNTIMRSNEATRQQLIKQQNTMTTNRIREVERTSLAMMASPNPIDVRYESSVINNVEYVTAEQHRQGMAQAAERGRALTLQALQNSVKSRRKVGLA